MNRPEKTWQQTKSENTRNLILDAAIHCIHKLGYNSTTTEKIAQEAGVSRGAMLHHFPTREDLIKAAIYHLSSKRLSAFEEQEHKIQRNAIHSKIEEGVDVYWEHLHSPDFVVFLEFQMAARTDPWLKKILVPVIEEFDKQFRKSVENIFPDLAMSKNIYTANLLNMFLLEGMAISEITRGGSPKHMLDWLKGMNRELFRDVKTINRESALSKKRENKDKRPTRK